MKIWFILIVLVGCLFITIFGYQYLGPSNIAEYIALFTSVSTAIYTILREPKERTDPFLRITPVLRTLTSHFVDSPEKELGLDIWIENIGYSIAKDIEVKCTISDKSIYVKDNGTFKHQLLAPTEKVLYQAVELNEKLLHQQLTIEASYSNEDDKKQKPIRKEYRTEELEQRLREVKTS